MRKNPATFDVICLGTLGVVFFFAGCAPAPTTENKTSDSLTNMGQEPLQQQQQKPLPEKALVKFDQLKPEVSKPENVPYNRQLHENANKAIAEATDLVRRKDFPGAIEKFQRAQGFDPNNPQIHRLLAETYLNMSDFKRAYENFTLASKYLGDDISLQLGLGRLCVIQKKYDQGIRHFRMALLCSNAKDSNPKKAMALLMLYRLLENKGYWTAGLECNERLSKLLQKHSRDYYETPSLQNVLMNPEVLLAERGRLLLQLRKYHQAAEMLRRAYERNKSYVPTAVLLLQVQIHNKQYHQAEDLVISLAEQKNLVEILPRLTRKLCVASGDRSMPMRIWEQLNKQNSNVPPELRIALSEALIQLDSPEDARKILESLSREDPSNLQAVTLLGILDAKSGDPVQGFKRLGNLVAQTAQNPPNLLPAIQKILAASKKTDTTLAQEFGAETYRDMSDNKFAMHYVAGFLAQQSGNKFLAADHFKRAIDAKKDFYPAYDALLAIRLDDGASQQVSEILDQIKAQASKGFYYHFMLGKVRLQQDRIDEAISALEIAQEKNSAHLPTLLKLSEAYYLKAGRTPDPVLLQQASEMLRMGLGIDPQREDIYRWLFDSYIRQGDLPAAKRLAGQAIRNLPGNPLGGFLAAEAYMLAGEQHKTDMLITNLRKQYPNDVRVQLLVIRSQIRRYKGVLPKKIYDSLVMQLEDLLKKYPDNIEAQRILAQLYDMTTPGLYIKAAEIWEKLYQRHPNDVTYGKALGISLFQAEEYKRLLPVAQKLNGQMPKNEKMRTMLAEALLKNGQIDEAIRWGTKWWNLNKKSYVCIALLIKIYTESQRFTEGIEFLHKLSNFTGSRPFSQGTLQYFEMELLVRGKLYDKLTKFVLDSNSLDVATSGGYLLMRAKQPRQAISLLGKVLERMEQDKGKTTEPAEAKKTPKENTDAKERLLKMYVWCLVEGDQLKTTTTFVEKYPVSSALGRKLREAFLSSLLTKNPGETSKALEDYQVQLRKQLKPEKLTEPLGFCDTIQAGILMAEQKYPDAMKLADIHLAKNPKNITWLKTKAYILSEEGKLQQASKISRQIYENEPNNTEFQNNYAYVLAEAGIDLEKAEKLIMESLAGSKSKTGEAPLASLDTLGWVLYKRGKLGEAGEVFEEIMQRVKKATPDSYVNESHPVMWDHAADTLYRLGWKKKALEYWTIALKDAKEKSKNQFSRDLRSILKDTPGKIKAVKSGGAVKVSPLGKNTQYSRSEKTQPTEGTKLPTTKPGTN